MTTSTSSSDPFRSLTKHEKYYITGADLCLLVENVHFRVHRYFFERESDYFVRKLATPASPGQPVQGTQDSNAILLENVSTENFSKLLWVFYNPLYSLYEAPVSDWEIVLDLAVRWEFKEIKNLAVRELEKKEIPDSKRIKLYHQNNVDKTILIPRYAALCEREAHLTLEEAQDIGMETVVMIAAGRQEVRAARLASGGRSPLSPTISGQELHEVVREVFHISLEAPSADPTGGLAPRTATPIKIQTKRQMAPPPIPQNHISMTILTQNNGPSKSTASTPVKKERTIDSAKKLPVADGLVAGLVNVFETKVEATEGSTMGGDGDLLGLSFASNQPPLTINPPSSVFGSIPFSNFDWP